MADFKQVTLIDNTTHNIRDYYSKIFHGTCNTAAGTTEKEVICSPTFKGTDLIKGVIVYVTFTVTNSAAVANIKLNVDNTGAKPIKYMYNNAVNDIPGVGYILANQTYIFHYDGTNWVIDNMHYNTNSTYSAMSVAEMRTGTATSSRTIRADYLKTFFSTLGGTGLTLTHSSNDPYFQLNHTNAITAQTTQALYPIKIDAQGHISTYGTAVTSLPASDVYDWAKAETKPSYAWSEITNKPSTFPPSAHDHDSVYVKKAGDTITGNINRYYSAASTDPMITALANNQDITLFTVGHGSAAGATTASNHYKLLYKGTGSSPNNYLQLIAHGSADKIAMQIDENANVSFTNTVNANISGNAATATMATDATTATMATDAANTQSNYGAKSFIINGDANTYYPTLFTGYTAHAAWTLLNISRIYNEEAPGTWNTTTHKGGLTLTILSNGDTGWGGNHQIGVQKLNTIIDLSQSYSTMVADIFDTNFGLVIWLRGGGAKYWVTSNGGQSVNVTTYYESHTQSDSTVAPITTVNTTRIDSYRWNNLWTINNATSATKDSDGNIIASTYVKRSSTEGIANQVAYYTATNTIGGSNNFTWDATNNKITVLHKSGKGDGFRTYYGTTVDMFFGIGSGNENHGIYDSIAGKWMIYADTSGNVKVNGTADVANKLGTTTVGSFEQPIYLNNGTATETGVTKLLEGATSIAKNVDLNTYATPGNYAQTQSAQAKTNLNTPFGANASTNAVAFRLTVESPIGGDYKRQIYESYNGGLSAERTSDSTGTSWSTWRTKLWKNSDATTTEGSASCPVYINGIGRALAITSVDTAHGGTGNTSFTANRLIYSESATKLSSATSLYATANAVGINTTSLSTPKIIENLANTQSTITPSFQVSGKSYHTDTLIIAPNKRAIEFRPDHASYSSYIYYGTAGNEALNFVNRNAVTSFSFWTGNSVNGSAQWYQDESGAARTDNPALQIKSNSVYINKLLPSGTNPAYKLYINGTTCGTDTGTFKALVISSTGADEHLKFSRAGSWNYITVPFDNASTVLSLNSSTGNANSYYQWTPTTYEPGTPYTKSLGTNSLRWKEAYIGAFRIGGDAVNTNLSRTITSNATFYINRPASSSIIFQADGVNKIWIDTPDNNLRPDQPNTLSIGTSSYKWANAYITTTHGTLDGNASTATKWETARTLTIGYKGQTVDGSADVTWDLHDILKTNINISTATSWDQTTPGVYYVSSSAAYTGTSNPESNTKDGTAGLYRYGQLIVSKAANGGLAQFYIAHNDSADNNKYGIHFRTGWNGNYLAKWRQLIDSGNYTNWTVTKTGDGASGTWGISITGNAATATAISTTGGTTAKFWRGDNTWSSELTDKLTVKYLTISSTEANEHLKFSRTDNPNYIIAPLTSNSLSGSIAIGSSTSQRSFRITKDDISPYDATATATSRLGTQALPWKELFILSQSSSANANGIQFSDKTAVKGRLGVNTSGGVGLYGADSIYIRPSLTASDIGLIIKTDKTVVPGADSSHSLGSTALHWQHGYYDDLFVSTNTTYVANNSAVAGTTIQTGAIHITGSPPKLILHRGSAAAETGVISSETNYGIQLSGVASATGVPVYITGTAGSTGFAYNNRTIKPILQVNGLTYVNNNIETNSTFIVNKSAKGDILCGYHNNQWVAAIHLSTLGTAAVGTTTTDPDTGTETTTYSNTTGEVILLLGNSVQGTSGLSNSAANNARGRVRFYGTGTKYTDLIPAQTGTNGNYTQYLPQASGYHQVNNSTVATSMSPSNWTIANWNMSGEYYIPGVNAVGVGQLSDVARLKRRIYAAASSNGYSDLYLGNNIPQGTAGNAHGGIVLYGTGAYYTYLRAQPNTANRNCYLPNYAGDTYLAHTANNNAVGGATTMPVYVAANGRLTAITSVDTAHGGTGNIGYTANRLVYSESATKLSSATSLYATNTALSVNNTSISSGINFQVTGNSLLNGITTMTGRLNIQYDDGDNTKLTISHPAITKGTVPTATTYSSLMFLDSSSNPAHAVGGGRLTMVESATGDNYNSIYMRAYIPSSASNNCADIKVTYNADGTSRAESTAPFWGAVWNDYAECRETKEFIEPGRCIRELGDDTLELTTERLQRGCEIVSDTFGFAIGETEKAKTPTATSGRVLAYLYEDREIAKQKIGWPVCSGPNGTVSIMTEEEEEKYPSRIIGTISAVPDYDVWYGGNNGDTPINVNGRIWIRIR